MIRPSRVILTSLALLCVAVTTAREGKTPDIAPRLGAIGVVIERKGPVALSAKQKADSAFFVRTDLGEDPFHAANIIPSSFSDKNQIYLLNATAGKYVIIGVHTPAYKGANQIILPSTIIYFDKSTILATEITVEEGKVSFAGAITIKIAASMKNADEAQRHYGELLGTGVGLKAKANVRGGTSLNIDKNPDTERKFWTLAAEKVFKNEPYWQEMVRRRLESAQ